MKISANFNICLIAACCFILPMLLSAQTESDSLAQAKQQEAEIKKEQLFNNLFGDGVIRAGGNGSPGNQGMPDTALTTGALSPSSLNSRVIERVVMDTVLEKEGLVVLSICLDSLGTVAVVQYTLKGSTILDQELIQLCKDNIMLWKFSPAELQMECGTVTYHFRAK